MENKDDNKLKDRILKLIKKHNSSLTQKVIFKKVDNVNKNKLKKIIEELIQDGKIIISKKGNIIPIESSEYIAAEIVSQSKNFVFAKSLYGSEEIFVSKYNINSAIIGDRVIINEIHNSEKGLSGNIQEIIEPGKRIVIGKVLKIGKNLELLCDSAVRFNIPIPIKYSNCAKDGDKVQARLFRNPPYNNLLAKIIKIYGKAESAKVCANALIELRNISLNFNPKSIQQAHQIANTKISQDIINLRLDLRKESTFTIDSEDAKDLDDAISIKKLPYGWELGVHIADVSYYINENTSLDQEAYSRGTSIYLADRVIPMIPEPISNGACSLNAGEDKLTFSAIINLNDKGEILSYKFVDSVINSKIKGVYSEINRIFNDKNCIDLQNKYSCVIDSIYLAKNLSDILSENTKIRGAIEISSDEPKFTINENGVCTNVETRKQGLAENIIENFMITANRAAAQYAKQRKIPFIYRTHSKPENKKIEILSKIADILGINSRKIRPGIDPREISELLEPLKGLPSYKIISRQILQTMSKAQYTSEPLGHFGLSLEDYCHFTSPIRRYPDICVHRILKSLQNGKIYKTSSKKCLNTINRISKQSTSCEIQAMKIERDTNKYYMAEFMSKNIGTTYTGIIHGINTKGIFVDLENSISGFLDISYYKDYNFIFDGFTCYFDPHKNKKLSVGDSIKVKVISVNISLGTIDFAPDE